MFAETLAALPSHIPGAASGWSKWWRSSAAATGTLQRRRHCFPKHPLLLGPAAWAVEALAAVPGALPALRCIYTRPPACPLMRCCSCLCCSGFLAIRETLQESYPTLTPAYLQGSDIILAAACGRAGAACL